jgi:hypothetical protein
VWLNRQKPEEDQGVRPTGHWFAPDITLSEHIRKQHLNSLTDAIQLKPGISLDTAHQPNKMFDPDKK